MDRFNSGGRTATRSREAIGREVETIQQRAADQGKTVETGVVIGKAAPTIIEYATDHDSDHIVIGSRRRSGINRVLFGSVAEKVIRESPIPVMVVG